MIKFLNLLIDVFMETDAVESMNILTNGVQNTATGTQLQHIVKFVCY